MTAPRDKAREIVDNWLACGQGYRIASESARPVLEDAITAALIEARESALEEAATMFERDARNLRRPTVLWGTEDAAHAVRKLKGKP